MPFCSPGEGEDKRTCGYFSSPRERAVDDAPDTVSRHAQYRTCDHSSPPLTPRMFPLVMDELGTKITLLGERVMSLESALAQKARDDEVKLENAHNTFVSNKVDVDIGGMGKLLASVEGLPEELKAATDAMQQENIEAHARLHGLLHSLAEDLPRAFKASIDIMAQENAQAHLRLQESLQHLEKRTESAIDQYKEHAVELKDEMQKVHRAIAQPGPHAIRHDPEGPTVVSIDDRADGVPVVGKKLPRPRSSRHIRMIDAAEMHQEDAAETLAHMTAKKKDHNDEIEKRRAALEAKKEYCQELKNPPKNQLSEFVKDDVFGSICSLIIVVNTIVIGIQTSEAVSRACEGDFSVPQWFHISNIVFVIWFCIELCIRLMAERFAFFIGAEWYWNLFDTLMILEAFAELIHSGGKYNYTFLRVLKVFRMCRALRMLRVFRYVRDLRLMVVSIAGSALPLFWAFILMLILISCCSVLICEHVAWYVETEWDNGASTQRDLKHYYGSVTKAMYSLVLAISGGEDWVNIVTPLYNVGPFVVFVFIVYTLFVIFGMLNVLTGIFVDRATEMTNLDRDIVIASERLKVETFSKSLVGVFKEMDSHQAGFITWPEFQAYCDREDVKAYFESVQLSVGDAQELFQMLDNSHSGHVSITDFINGCTRLKGQARSLDLLHVQQEISQVKNLIVCNQQEMLSYLSV